MERHGLVLLLLATLRALSLSRAAPLPGESVMMRAKVRLNAEQLSMRLAIYLQQHRIPQSASPPSDPLDSLSTLVTVLRGYEGLLAESLEGLGQARQEASFLRSYLDGWRQSVCGGPGPPRPKPLLQGRLAKLQSSKRYLVITVGMEAALGLKEYLDHLLHHLEYLEIC